MWLAVFFHQKYSSTACNHATRVHFIGRDKRRYDIELFVAATFVAFKASRFVRQKTASFKNFLKTSSSFNRDCVWSLIVIQSCRLTSIFAIYSRPHNYSVSRLYVSTYQLVVLLFNDAEIRYKFKCNSFVNCGDCS